MSTTAADSKGLFTHLAVSRLLAASQGTAQSLATLLFHTVLGHRSAPGSAAAADMPAIAESSATEETASDASYSADEQSEERYMPAVRQERGSMPSSKASCGVHCLYQLSLQAWLLCCNIQNCLLLSL